MIIPEVQDLTCNKTNNKTDNSNTTKEENLKTNSFSDITTDRREGGISEGKSEIETGKGRQQNRSIRKNTHI